MEASIRPKESTLAPALLCHQATSLVKISSSDNFSGITSLNSDTNVNNNDLNTAASLSDDSGIPQTTNSSISSGDSYNLEMCKYGTELVESDAEVSQFDSLENCSEGGMSAENFNTLKKGPLAPIDPPPEFQDSPNSTLGRSLCQPFYNSLRRSTSSNSSFLFLKDRGLEKISSKSNISNEKLDSLLKNPLSNNLVLTEIHQNNKHIFSSDSILNANVDILCETSHLLESNISNRSSEVLNPLNFGEHNRSIKSMQQNKCPYYEDHSRYFKAISIEQDNIESPGQHGKLHDVYNGSKRVGQQLESTMIRTFIRSPISHSYHCHQYQACCGNRPNSRNSLCSRLSSSHNSLNVSSTNKPDDSIFITQAMSHDALLSREITDFYTVPIDSDIYAFPIDMIESEKGDNLKCKNSSDNSKLSKQSQSRLDLGEKNKSDIGSASLDYYGECKSSVQSSKYEFSCKSPVSLCSDDEYGTKVDNKFITDAMQLSIEEVKEYYQSLFSAENGNLHQRYGCQDNLQNSRDILWTSGCINNKSKLNKIESSKTSKGSSKTSKVSTEVVNSKNDVTLLSDPSRLNTHNLQKKKNSEDGTKSRQNARQIPNYSERGTKKSVYINEKRSQFTLTLKQKFCSIFRFRRAQVNETQSVFSINDNHSSFNLVDRQKKFQKRALPPVPKKITSCEEGKHKDETKTFHFASSIEKVKDYGWYWGPLSSEAAEKVLSNEPDGSFIVRDSSDDHYIFSLSFKLNNCVRHVRIEQDQGTFSFGSYAKFKSQTITEFIEKAVDHSRSGRYLFFLHRRPEHGPMRVQLTNPVSRFKHVQSLQHMCRFVILKTVIRTDLIQTLPLPRRLLDYLNYKHCFSEHIENDNCHSQTST